jgi:hypothetical protein
MISMRFIGACPKGIATGGIEVLYHLVHALNSFTWAALWNSDKLCQSDLPVPSPENLIQETRQEQNSRVTTSKYVLSY